MALNKIEQIMQAVESALTGLTTTGTNVFRDRDEPLEDANSLSIEQGEYTPVEVQGNTFVDARLTLSVMVAVKKNNTYSEQINLIVKEVYQAIMADRELGLPAFVSDILPTGISKPEVSGEGSTTVMKSVIDFEVKFQHLIIDVSA